MPERSNRVRRRNEETDQYELPYISKSRVMTWLNNPDHYRLKYLEGHSVEETGPMVRGSRIHETFEHFGNETRAADDFVKPSDPGALPEDRQLWADFVEPYIGNFFKREKERFAEADGFDEYVPIAVEEEVWLEDRDPEWMGIADVVLHAGSVPEVDAEEGVVIVDYKTGKVPDEQYRHPGIYTELQYYKMVFESEYDVVGALAFYPREDEVIVLENDYAANVESAVEELVEACESYEGDTKFEAKPGPLCGWSKDPDDRSPLYGVCDQCTWNVPVQAEETFKHLLEEDYSDEAIANHLGCDQDAVRYWRRKYE